MEIEEKIALLDVGCREDLRKRLSKIFEIEINDSMLPSAVAAVHCLYCQRMYELTRLQSYAADAWRTIRHHFPSFLTPAWLLRAIDEFAEEDFGDSKGKTRLRNDANVFKLALACEAFDNDPDIGQVGAANLIGMDQGQFDRMLREYAPMLLSGSSGASSDEEIRKAPCIESDND